VPGKGFLVFSIKTKKTKNIREEKMKKLLALILALIFCVGLFAGCSSSGTTDTTPEPTSGSAATPAPATEAPAPGEEDEEDYTTGDASLDDPLNADGIGETELLIVSFGTSFNDSRRETIGAIEKAMIEAFPEMDVRRGFTSQIIIDHVLRRDGEVIDNMTQALDRAVANGVKNLVVQPTHLMSGFEYNDVVDEIASYADAFESVSIGRPILDTDTDFQVVAEAIVAATAEYDDGNTAIVFMGHGTEAESNGVYAKMQTVLTKMGAENYFIGTVEAEPSVEDVLALVQAGDYSRVVLEPLMIVAGDHANNDMAGGEEDSWNTIFENAGYEVICLLRGLGSFPEIQQLLIEHVKNALEEDYTTGDASLDDPLNADGIGETELLVVSFGTSFNDSRVETIGAIEKAMIEAFPQMDVRRGFTSQIIIDHVLRRDGEVIDNMTQALDRAVANGVKYLVVQPTHLMPGFEYNDVVEEVASYADAFESVSIGRPILDTDEDFQVVAQAIVAATAEYDDGNTAIVFMGHGTEADSNGVYAKMQTVLSDMGAANYFIGTVEAEPSVEDVLALVQAGDYSRVVLEPLMIVAGDHANNDMAGGEEDSWNTIFENAGYEVICLLRGLGSFPEIQQLLIEHAQAAAKSVPAGRVASADQMTTVEDVLEEGMVPITADALKDGTYPVTVDCSSSMFRIADCALTVSGGEMTAVMTMGGTAYPYVYMGTALEAAMAEASGSGIITYAENAEGAYTFTVPVEALDAAISLAAFSKNKELWYDRTLVFRADSLPAEAFADGFFTTAASLGLADGEYSVAVALAGGSGKASVTSPTALTVAGGECTAEIEMSSPNYDYMVVGDTTYYPVNTEGNSTFVIPVSFFDRPMAISADTVAMSTPHEIEYTLTFDSATLEALS